MRIIEVLADCGHADTIRSIAEQQDIVECWIGHSEEETRCSMQLVVQPEKMQTVIDAIQSSLSGSENWRILIKPVEAIIPRSEEAEEKEKKHAGTRAREEIYTNVEAGARHAVETARSLRGKGHELAGVRLDSGDMAAQSRLVRRIFDDAGFPGVKIFASSSLDEFSITELITGGARIDAFGVGTRMGVSADRPYLDIVYKLVHIDGRDVRLVDREGNEHPFQLWRVERSGDGTIASARISFYAALPANGSYRYELVSGSPAPVENVPFAKSEGLLRKKSLLLDNGVTAVRLPPLGRHNFTPPLRFGSSQAEMVALYGRQARAGIAPGPA